MESEVQEWIISFENIGRIITKVPQGVETAGMLDICPYNLYWLTSS